MQEILREMDSVQLFLYGAAVVFTIAYILVRAKKLPKTSTIREYAEACFVAIWLALGIRTLLVENYAIPSESMVPTFLVNDRLFVSKLSYGWHFPGMKGRVLDLRKPQRGDIIIFAPPHKPHMTFVKRCVGIPGDTLEVRGKSVYINGKLTDYPQAIRTQATWPKDYRQGGMWEKGMREGFIVNKDWMKPYKLPEGMYWMMGDNRDNSMDSRYFGEVPYENLKGKPLLRYWPVKRFGKVE